MGLIGAFLRFDVQEWCFVRCATAFIVILLNPPWPPGRDGRGRHATAKAIVQQKPAAMESTIMSEQGVTEPLDPEREEAIRKQAYALWHEQGQPEGKDREHWLQAEQERDGHGGQTSAPAAPSREG